MPDDPVKIPLSDARLASLKTETTESRLRKTLAAGRIGTWSLDLAKGDLQASKVCKANYGRAEGEPFTYGDLAGSVIEQDRARWEHIVQQAVAEGSDLEVEYRIRWPDGSPHSVLVRGCCITDAGGRTTGMSGISIDITQQKLDHEKLGDAQARLEATLAAGDVATWTWEIGEDCVTADRNLAHMFAVSEAIANGGPIAAYVAAIHPEDRERVMQQIGGAIERGGRYEAQYRVRNADGEYRYVVGRGQAEYDANGTPLRMPGVIVDVTRRTIAELALRETQERYRILFNSLDDGFCVLEKVTDSSDGRLDFRYVEVNPAFATQTGVSVPVGRTVREVFPGEIDRWLMVYDEVLRTGVSQRIEREVPFIQRTLELSIFRVAYDSRQRVGVIFKDISVRRTAERKLRTNEERLRNLLLVTGAGTWSLDLSSGILEADAELRELHMYPANGPIGLDQGFSPLHPEDVARVKAAVAEALDGANDGHYAAEYRVVNDAGDTRWIESRGRAYFDENNKVIRFTGTGRDITARKRAEEDELRLRREAEAANRTKDEFLAMLGHEMRNPLAPITTALQIMKLRAEDAFVKERTIIERQVNHLTRLVDDLLDISRITSGKVEIHRRRVELATVVASAVEIVSPLLERRQHFLHVDVPTRGLEVDADTARLAQVFSNLLANAAKYTEPGGRIEIVADQAEGDAVLRIRDNGVGIASEMLPHVFELFAQERQSIERAQGGLGLGLAIVKTIVTIHGGSVSAHSEGRNLGSEFLVRLPLALERAKSVEAPSVRDGDAPCQAALGRRVLIVDDNRDAVELLATALEMMGHEVRTAADGLEALQVVDSFTPELAVLDIGLPVMDGYELGRRLRERPTLAQLPLVALTGYGQSSDRARSVEAGFNVHLVKPVQISQILEILAES